MVSQTGNDIHWQEKILPNGLKIIHIPTQKEDKRFYLSALIQAGSRMEVNFPTGITHFLEHMMFRGSKNFPSFAQLTDAFEWLGGEWNGETGHEYTEYSFFGSIQVFDQAIKLFSEFLKTPALCDLERERKVILREIDDELNDYGHSTDLDYHLATVLWPNTSMSHPITGTKDSVKSITKADLLNYRRQFYTSERMILCSVGSCSVEEIMASWSKYFSDYPLIERYHFEPISTLPIYQGPKVRFIEHSDSQYHLQLSFVCLGEYAKDSAAYDLIIRLLGDGLSAKLTYRLREELGLVYDVCANLNQHTDCGTIDINASINPEHLGEFVKETCQILRDLSISGPTERELQKVKYRSLVDLELFSTDPESLGFRTSWYILHNKNPQISVQKLNYESVTIEDIKRVAFEIFTRKNLACIVMGPKSQKHEDEIKKIIANSL